MSSETWVIANTNTRSKNSSRLVTCCSPSRRKGIGRRGLSLIARRTIALPGGAEAPPGRGRHSGGGLDHHLQVVAVVAAVRHLVDRPGLRDVDADGRQRRVPP